VAEALSRRHASFRDFVLAQLPERRVPVLEVGCGRGELAVALADAGCLVTAIDDELEPVERELIAAESIQATGFRYVGSSFSPASGGTGACAG